jgi:hypothetical protein
VSVARSETERSLHADLLHRLVAASPGSTTADLQLLYDTIAPLVYHGTTSSPACRRWRREQLRDLDADGVITSVDTPSGRVWVPVELPDGVEPNHVATAPREAVDGE